MTDAILKLLNLRPTNAAMKLGPSWVPVLNPRDLQRALGSKPHALLTVPAYSRAAIAGVLSAARHTDAACGISVPFPLGERDAPDAFIEELRRASEEIRHTRPVFLQAGPFRLRSAEERAVDAVAAQSFRYLEAGCSLLSFDASALPLSQAAKLYARLSEVAAERELSVEVSAVRDVSSAPAVNDTRKLLQALAAGGVPVKYLRVDLASLPKDLGMLHDRVRVFAQTAAEAGVELALDDTVGLEAEAVRRCVELGCRKWDATEVFARRVTPALPPNALEALHARAAGVGRPWTELLGALSEGLSALEKDVRLRVEALAYDEARALFDAAKAGGTGSESVAFLSEQAGY